MTAFWIKGNSLTLRGIVMVAIEIFVALVAVVSSEIVGGRYVRPTPAPSFGQTPTNVTFRRGELAVLRCTVTSLGTKTVVWRRYDSTFPLTIATMVMVEDDRFQVGHVTYQDRWDLMIKNVQPEDNGTYECQVSSTDKHIRRQVTLTVLDPEENVPEIQITPEQYVERGERIELQCNATGEYYPPDEMDWFRNGDRLTTRRQSGMKITKQFSILKRTFSSVLSIERATMDDDGTYVCRSSNMQITSTKVHVLNAETFNRKRGTLTDSEKYQKETSQQVYDNRSSSGALITMSKFLYTLAMIGFFM